MENSNINEYDVDSVFKFTRPTEYNTFFGRYLIIRIHISHGNGILGILDINKHPMVYHQIEVKINEANSELVPQVNTFSWTKDQSDQVVELSNARTPQQDDKQLACLVRGFADRIVMIMENGISCSHCTAGLAPDGDFVVSPEINAIGACTLLWLEVKGVEEDASNSLYFPMFKLDKPRGVFYYSKIVDTQPYVEFSSVEEFKQSEYYIQGDDIAPIALAQQEECLLEVERQLIGTIN